MLAVCRRLHLQRALRRRPAHRPSGPIGPGRSDGRRLVLSADTPARTACLRWGRGQQRPPSRCGPSPGPRDPPPRVLAGLGAGRRCSCRRRVARGESSATTCVWRPLVAGRRVGAACSRCSGAAPTRLRSSRSPSAPLVVLDASPLRRRRRRAVGLYTMVFVLLLPYALFRWGSGREVVIGLGVHARVGVVSAIAGDFTGVDRGDRRARRSCCFPARSGVAVRYRAGVARSASSSRSSCASASSWPASCTTPSPTTSRPSPSRPRPVACRRRRPIPTPPSRRCAVIEDEASRTLAEMRAMVGVLRDGRGRRPRAAAGRRRPRAARRARRRTGRASRSSSPATSTTSARRSTPRSTASRRSRSPTPLRHARHATRVDGPRRAATTTRCG